MSKEMREQIDRVKKYIQFLNENINTTQNIQLDWNLCNGLEGYLPEPDEDVLTLCDNDGTKFYKVQYYSKNHGYWSESPFVIAWSELPEYPNF